MEQTIPSRTALRVALRRAAHQLYDSPLVFADPLAVPILGSTYAEELARTPLRLDRPFSIALRAFIVARSRYAEDHLFRFASTGGRQYVLLGAGFDTFAYRNPFPKLRVFEVDHPATQEWKRRLLGQSGIPIPESLTYVPVDFEREFLRGQLLAAGFDEQIPTFFAWLGVVPYLTLDAFRATLGFVAGQPPGASVVLDYGQPRAVLPPLEQLAHDSLAARVEGAGEPFQLFFTPVDIAAAGINARYFRERTDQLRVRGTAGRLLTAWSCADGGTRLRHSLRGELPVSPRNRAFLIDPAPNLSSSRAKSRDLRFHQTRHSDAEFARRSG